MQVILEIGSEGSEADYTVHACAQVIKQGSPLMMMPLAEQLL